jgi:hypothetical protein
MQSQRHWDRHITAGKVRIIQDPRKAAKEYKTEVHQWDRPGSAYLSVALRKVRR